MNGETVAAYAVGLLTLPTLGALGWFGTALLLPTRRWFGCHVCTFWTTSRVPVVRWAQWQRHRFWAILSPADHAAYGRAHPPREDPEDPEDRDTGGGAK